MNATRTRRAALARLRQRDLYLARTIPLRRPQHLDSQLLRDVLHPRVPAELAGKLLVQPTNFDAPVAGAGKLNLALIHVLPRSQRRAHQPSRKRQALGGERIRACFCHDRTECRLADCFRYTFGLPWILPCCASALATQHLCSILRPQSGQVLLTVMRKPLLQIIEELVHFCVANNK